MTRERSTLSLLPSASICLGDLPCAMNLHQGACHLFVVAKLQEGLGAHHYVMSLSDGDDILPMPDLCYEQDTYAFILVARENCELSPQAAASAAPWQERWEDALRSQFACLDAGDMPYDQAFIKHMRAAASARAAMRNENKAMVQMELAAKVAALGSMANIELEAPLELNQETDALYLTLQEIARLYHLSFDVSKDVLLNKNLDVTQRLTQFCERSHWRMRAVLLGGDFYKQSSSPLLAFRQSTGAPIILLPSSQTSSYISVEESLQKRPLTRTVAADVDPKAYCFYELFPEGKLTKKKLLHFVFAQAKPILFLSALVGGIASLLGLISPIATAYITGHIIPTANLPELVQISVLLVVLLASQVLLGVVPSLISMMFSARQFERFQAAVFDHILRIPIQAIKMCDAGDMTQRILGANQIQAALMGLVSQQFLSSIFSLTSLVMMFYYSSALSFAGILMVLVYAVSFYLLARVNLKPLALHAAAAGRLSGLMKQFFDGISKIRAAGAEKRVMSRFMDDFSQLSQEEYKLSTLGAYQTILTSTFPLFISIVFYAMAGGLMKMNLEFPIFLAFMSAFQNFQGGVMGLAGGLWTLQSLKPEIDRIMPVLEERVEDSHDKHMPGVLDGDIRISHLHFRYAPDAPLVLKDVSIHARSGEFVAIVGASGAGKSSLVRLLLGFEQYESGGIYYSGKELSHLNLRAVRRQMGVILQNSKVLPASILDNIATGTQSTIDDAYAALRLAAFENEVRDLPMGIHTMVNPSTISGGQQQRILIARAMVGKPVALIMDESTSALDNAAQKAIQTHMEGLAMTRIVIAHRLSTIANADRIYVLDKGQVVAQGTYSELLAQEGIFKELVQRQQLSQTH